MAAAVRTASCFFFFNDTATTEIYTLSLHDALPISADAADRRAHRRRRPGGGRRSLARSEEHTSELQSQSNLVCRLLLEKKKKKTHDMKTARSRHLRRPADDARHDYHDHSTLVVRRS